MAPRAPLFLALAWLASWSAAAGGDDKNPIAKPDGHALSVGFCCMVSPGRDVKPKHDDVCSNCGVAETSSYCGTSQENCEGCGKAWCSSGATGQSEGGGEVSTTAKHSAAKKHAVNVSERARHPKSKTQAQPEAQANTTAEVIVVSTDAVSTTASADLGEKGSKRKRDSARGHTKSKLPPTKPVPLRGMQAITTVDKTSDAIVDTTTPAAPASPSARPTTTGNATSTSTGTATATLTSTVSTATTRTKRRFPFPSMMCWLVIVTSGYEMDLVKPQCENTVSIWRCDEHIALGDSKVELCNGESTVAIGDMTSKISDWGSWSNTGNFVRAWGMVINDGRFRNHEWTVKVDADSVFYPERLRRQLEQHSSDKAVFLHNWRENFGFLGPVEVLSTQAVEKFGEGNQTCQANISVEGSGEDGWLDSCLRLLGIDFEDAFDILDFSGSVDACGNPGTAVFHDFKSWGKYSDCMSRGPPMEDAPPVTEEEEDNSDVDGGHAHEEDDSSGGGDSEGFCCSAAQDAGDTCGTCWAGARYGREDYCGVSRERCEDCAQTWCAASNGSSQVLMRAFSGAGPQAGAGRASPMAAVAAVALLASAGLAACRSRRASQGAAASQEQLALVGADGAAAQA